MIAVLLFLALVALGALAVIWLLDNPGTVEVVWLGQVVNLDIGLALAALVVFVILVVLLAKLISSLLRAPRTVSKGFARRRHRKSLSAVRDGLLSVGAGDIQHARDASLRAQRLVPDEPLTLLLKAQTAQLSGDGDAASSAFRTMLQNPETRTLGLRGLYVEAQRHGDRRLAERFALEAVKIKQDLPWAGRAVYEAQCRAGNWDAALETLTRLTEGRVVDRETARRHRATLLTAEALRVEGDAPEEAASLASEAHKLTPDLIPAALIAGRQASRAGDVKGATRIVETTWVKEPHYALAEVYAHARAGDSASDRLERVRTLARMMVASDEGNVAVARAAIEAKDWTAARDALQPQIERGPSRRDCMLMAHVEEMERGDTGAAREWLSRALSAKPDPAWVAGDIVTEVWAPISPVTGEVDAFRWRRPPENADGLLLEGRRDDAFLTLAASRKEAPLTEAATLVEDAIVADAEPQPAPKVVTPVRTAGESDTPHPAAVVGSPTRDGSGVHAAGAGGTTVRVSEPAGSR